VSSRSLPSLPSSLRYTLLHLPFSGSLEHHFPTFPISSTSADHRYYDPLRLPNALLVVVRCSLSFHDTLCCPDFRVPFVASGLTAEQDFSTGAWCLWVRRIQYLFLAGKPIGPPEFPGSPLEQMTRSQTPVVTLMLAKPHSGLLPSSA
jgi:hypothetical protein